MPPVVLIALGGATGAVARYAVTTWATTRFGDDFPNGTLLVNLAGSMLLGVVLGMALAGRLSDSRKALLGTGLLGAFTTFSTFSCDTLKLLEQGRYGAAVGYGLANVAGGLLAAWLGFALARQLPAAT